jgi:Flp pilus assembly protein TadD
LIEHGSSLDDWKESLRITLDTLEIEPKNPGAWRALALAQVKSGDMIGALESLQQSVVILPNNYRIRTELSLLLNDLGKRKEAEIEIAEARRLWSEQGKQGNEPMLPEPQMGPMLP